MTDGSEHGTVGGGSSSASFIDTVLHYTLRDELLVQCPALALLCYQHMVRGLLTGQPLHDAFAHTSRQDALGRYLRCRSVHALLQCIFAPDDDSHDGEGSAHSTATATITTATTMQQQLRRSFQAALHAASTPACLPLDAADGAQHSGDVSGDTAASLSVSPSSSLQQQQQQQLLHTIGGVAHFAAVTRRDGDGVAARAVGVGTLYKAAQTSRRFLRSVTACALSGSLHALRERKQLALSNMVQQAHLVPASTTVSAGPRSGNSNSSNARTTSSSSSTTAATAARGEQESSVTSAGLNFCMMPLQQQWWVLVSAALDRVLVLTQTSSNNNRRNSSGASAAAVTRPLLWQLLAVLACLDAERVLYAFPERDADVAGHHLLARLAEVGLVYPVLAEGGCKCFVLSPHFRHALTWHTTAPLCLSLMLYNSRPDDAAAAAAATAATAQASSDESVTAVRREDVDMIITETNFRLYAYTRNPDLLRILDQFAVREEVVEDVLVCYRITRSSFAAALYKGIGARQVLKFLSLRAHPSMLSRQQRQQQQQQQQQQHDDSERNKSSVTAADEFAVPQSICDQLFMWEVECNRVTFDKALVLLRNVTSEQHELLTRMLAEAGEADAVVHSEPGLVVVREAVYDRLLAPLLTAATAPQDDGNNAAS